MKAFLNPCTRAHEWKQAFFPERSLCALPLAGKPFAEYVADLCSLLDVSELRILDYDFEPDFHRVLSSGERWSMPIQYAGAALCPDLWKDLERNAAYLDERGEPTLIFRGAFLPTPTRAEDVLDSLGAELRPGDEAQDGLFLWKDGVLRKCDVPCVFLRSVRDWFELNFDLLKNPGIHTLPGYSAEDSIYAGMNVAIMPGCEITPPAMLCDDIFLSRDCRLSGGAIVGRNSFLDHGAVLRHSIVMDHAFVGKNLEFENKIVAENRIIDPYANVAVEQEDMDASLVSGMRSFSAFDWRRGIEWLLLLALALVFLLPYLLWLPWKRLTQNSIWAYKLSTDRYPKVLRALFRRGRLVKLRDADKNYVLRASEGLSALPTTPEQRKIDDLYYRHHRTVHLMLSILVKSLVKRSFANDAHR